MMMTRQVPVKYYTNRNLSRKRQGSMTLKEYIFQKQFFYYSRFKKLLKTVKKKYSEIIAKVTFVDPF